MEFRILGSTEVVDGARRVDLPAGRGRALLVLLALHAGEVITADALIDDLWGVHPPVTASTVVQGLVSRLRRILEPNRAKGEPAAILQTVGTGYRLAIEPQDVDAHRFQHMLDDARNTPDKIRAQLLADALALWRGPALADFRYEPFAQRAISALEELRLVAAEDRIDADLALGRHAQLVPELEQLTTGHPFRERLTGQLMLALYREGRQAEALASYRSLRATLVEELGIEPGPDVRRLEEAILRQDRALDSARPTTTSTGEPTGAPWLPRERRTVTAVVAEIAASSGADSDPEALARLATSATEAGKDVLRRHGGRVDEFIGETVVGFFGLPAAHEDDALRAVRAAVELRTAGLAARIGIDTGEVVVGPGGEPAVRTRVSGPVVNAAARLQQAADPGEVIVGSVTQHLVTGAVVVEPLKDLRGLGEGSTMWRVLDVVGDASALARQLESPMFGRQHELSLLRTSFRRTLRSGRAAQFTVVGEAGIGKTRLAKAFIESIGSEARVITGRCPSYGEGITFLPLRDALASIGAELPEGSPAVLFPAIRRLLEDLAGEQPLVVVFDDIHWAEPTLIDLIEYVAGTATASLFLLCLTRAEFFEDRRAPDDQPDVLVLEPLRPTDIEELIAERRRGGLGPNDVRRIVETSRGNPLFAEQLLAAVSDGSLDDVPASLQSLLAMRLDRLGPAERDLLRCAAVVGTDCDRDALSALLPEEAYPFLDRHIAALQHKRLIEPESGTLRFAHVLIQRAAYQSMTREDRARLHKQYAAWLESAASAPPDLDEIVGYHLEQVVTHRRASGLVDDTLPALATRAGERLADAAGRAHTRFDITAVENLLSRARALLPVDHPRRIVVTQGLAEVSLIVGRLRQGQELLDELIQRAEADGDEAYKWAARLERARIQYIIGPDPIPLAAIREEADAATAYFTDAGDEAGQGRAIFLRANVLMREGRMTAAAEAFRESLAVADRAEDIREQMANRWMLGMVGEQGPVPVADCLAMYEQWSTVHGVDNPGIMLESAVLQAMLGQFDRARQLTERARELVVERMRVRRLLRFVAEARGAVEMLAGEYAAAEREFRTMWEAARSTGEPEPLALAAAGLATALSAQGRHEEAAHFAALSVESAPADAAAAQARSLAAMARVASRAGDHVKAKRLARAAVRWATDEMPSLRGDVFVELAEVLRAGGNAADAVDAAKEAARCYERKGNVVSRARVPYLA